GRPGRGRVLGTHADRAVEHGAVIDTKPWSAHVAGQRAAPVHAQPLPRHHIAGHVSANRDAAPFEARAHRRRRIDLDVTGRPDFTLDRPFDANVAFHRERSFEIISRADDDRVRRAGAVARASPRVGHFFDLGDVFHRLRDLRGLWETARQTRILRNWHADRC